MASGHAHNVVPFWPQRFDSFLCYHLRDAITAINNIAKGNKPNRNPVLSKAGSLDGPSKKKVEPSQLKHLEEKTVNQASR